jgi:dihydroorotase
MTRLKILNGHLLDPQNKRDGAHNLYIEDGQIIALDTPPANFQTDSQIDASGKIVCPGLIDLCARVRSPGADSAWALEKELRSAVAGGITRLVCPPDTMPVIDMPATALLEQDLAGDTGLARIHPIGAMTRKLEGKLLTDMAMLDEAGCVGVGNALKPIADTLILRRAMQYASTYDIKIFLTPFDPYLLGNGCLHEGALSTELGLPSIPEAAETVAVARDLALIETAGVRAHIQLLSSARALEMIEHAQNRELPVSASVAAHHLHICETDMPHFDPNYKVLPPFREHSDRQALRDGIKNGVISSVCSDHQSRGRDTKLAPFSEASSGVIGLQTLLSLTLRLADEGVCSRGEAIALLTTNPAREISIDAGHLAPGQAADICIFDPEETWELTPDSLYCRGQSSPFIGQTLKGKVSHTLINGRVVYPFS